MQPELPQFFLLTLLLEYTELSKSGEGTDFRLLISWSGFLAAFFTLLGSSQKLIYPIFLSEGNHFYPTTLYKNAFICFLPPWSCSFLYYLGCSTLLGKNTNCITKADFRLFFSSTKTNYAPFKRIICCRDSVCFILKTIQCKLQSFDDNENIYYFAAVLEFLAFWHFHLHPFECAEQMRYWGSRAFQKVAKIFPGKYFYS